MTINIEELLKEPMQPWRKDLLNAAGSFKPGEMTIMTSGRQTGKSSFFQYSKMFDEIMKAPTYKKLAAATVDGEEWVTVQCNPTIAKWVRGQKTHLWYEHIQIQPGPSPTKFDLSDKLYTILQLKFQ